MQGSVLLLEQRTTGQQGAHYGVRLPAGSVLPTRVAAQAVEFAECSKQVSYTGLSYSAGGEATTCKDVSSRRRGEAAACSRWRTRASPPRQAPVSTFAGCRRVCEKVNISQLHTQLVAQTVRRVGVGEHVLLAVWPGTGTCTGTNMSSVQ